MNWRNLIGPSFFQQRHKIKLNTEKKLSTYKNIRQQKLYLQWGNDPRLARLLKNECKNDVHLLKSFSILFNLIILRNKKGT